MDPNSSRQDSQPYANAFMFVGLGFVKRIIAQAVDVKACG